MELTEIAEAGVYHVLNMPHKVSDEHLKALQRPSESIMTSQKLNVEHSETDVADRLSQLVYTYQIASARLKKVPSYSNKDSASINNALDWAVLYCLTENCFKYSRGITESIPEKLSENNTKALFHTVFAVHHQIDIKKSGDLIKAWERLVSDQDFDLTKSPFN